MPAPRLVLMTADAMGGVWSYALTLAGGLAQAGTATLLAAMGRRPSDAQRAEAAAVPGLILEESDFRLEWMPEAQDHVLRAGTWLLQLERRYAPDVVHVNGFAHAALRWRAPCVAVAHSCVLSWWRAVHGTLPPAEWDGYARDALRGLHAADLVVAPTVAFLAEIQALYGPLTRARAIANGYDAGLFTTSGRKREVIFSAGRVWDEAKNVAALDAVAPRLPWPVVVAGDWRRPDGAGEPPEHVLCLSVIDREQVRGWVAESAIYASPARYEPFGLGALEAALSGCALVLGDIPTFRELWSDAALFVPPDDHDALEAALRDLIERPALREDFARAARARALRYSLDRMVEGYLDAYAAAGEARSLAAAATLQPRATGTAPRVPPAAGATASLAAD